MAILVTGGAGYIGSHTVLELLNTNEDVIVVDNLMNSKEESLKRVSELTGKNSIFHKVDLLNAEALDDVFQKNSISSVIHFAGLKAVGESVEKPLFYYNNNITGTLNLCASMLKHKVNDLVFSSSATVYGDPHTVPILENFPLQATNPYGRTKLMIEEILRDLAVANPQLNIALLRYFNPVGAHKSGRIGEDPNGIPNNLLPFISQVAVGKLEKLRVFGNDYNTKDGTGVRDYIHVVDLALGHLAALKKLKTNPGVVTYNLGTGQGYSVLEMIEAFSTACGNSIPFEIVARRPGDVAACYANPDLAQKDLDWTAKLGLTEICEDTWRWQSENPRGYEE